MMRDKRQAEYDKLLKLYEDLNRKAKHTKQRLAVLRYEMEKNPQLVDERPDEINMK